MTLSRALRTEYRLASFNAMVARWGSERSADGARHDIEALFDEPGCYLAILHKGSGTWYAVFGGLASLHDYCNRSMVTNFVVTRIADLDGRESHGFKVVSRIEPSDERTAF